jgi:hypothetical protein
VGGRGSAVAGFSLDPATGSWLPLLPAGSSDSSPALTFSAGGLIKSLLGDSTMMEIGDWSEVEGTGSLGDLALIRRARNLPVESEGLEAWLAFFFPDFF